MEEHPVRSADSGPELSVIIPTHNRSSLLRATLDRLLASSLHCAWEVVVVANACTDDTTEVVEEVAGDSGVSLRLIEESRPSASVARNRGAQASSGALLVFVDDDILLGPDVLATIWEWFGRSDRCSLLLGQVRPLPEHLATPFGAFREVALRAASPPSGTEDVDWFASGLAAVPMAAFGVLGGYAEDYPSAGLEDADFAIRARRAGFRIVFEPSIVGLHNDWAGSTAQDFCRRTAAHCATAPRLAERFPDNDHPWGRLVEVNRPPAAGDDAMAVLRKRLKLLAVWAGADRWLPVLADRTTLPRRPRELLYKVAVSLAMFAGYQRGLRQIARAPDGEPRASRSRASSPAERLSILIVTFNCGDEVERAISALERHPPSVSQEIIVVDNASEDGTVARLRARFPQVLVIALEDNIGYGAAINRGVKASSGDHLLFLNPDTEVTAGAVDTMLRLAATTERVGVVGPRLVLGNGLPQPSARRLPSPWRHWFEVLRLHRLLPRASRSRLLGGTYSAQDTPGPVDWVSGACHLVPRHVWDRIGGLTELTFCGFDDLDYCWRARDAGFATWFCPDALVLHHAGASVSRRWTPEEIDAVGIHNMYVVLATHWGRPRVKLYCAAELAGTVTDLAVGARRQHLGEAAAQRYRAAAWNRCRLLSQLLLGLVRPIERHEPGKVAASSAAPHDAGATALKLRP